MPSLNDTDSPQPPPLSSTSDSSNDRETTTSTSATEREALCTPEMIGQRSERDSSGSPPIRMHVSGKHPPSADSQEELESCQIKDRTNSRSSTSQISQSSSGNGVVVGGGVGVEGSRVNDLDSCGASDGSGSGYRAESVIEEEQTDFCVGDVRKRLTQHSSAPKKMFQRDPNDPSGVFVCVCGCVGVGVGVLKRERERERERMKEGRDCIQKLDSFT